MSKYIKKILGWLYLGQFYKLLKILPINKRKIIFSSFVGRQVSGNPKALYEKIIKLKKQYKCVWVYNDESYQFTKNTKVVKRFSFGHLYHLATAKYRIDDCVDSHYFKPRRGSIYLQTWHGTPLKKIANDKITNKDLSKNKKKKNTLLDTCYWDFLISPSDEVSNILSKAFNIDKKIIIKTGYPRNEILLDYTKQDKKEVLKNLKIKTNKKIILYAPTFRDDEKDSFNLKLNYNKLFERLSQDYIILIRMHSNVEEVENNFFDGEFTFNVSSYDDVQELYIISDLLITDYSSVFFDYALLERPMLFYAYDMDKYAKELRGFYFDYEELVPGDIVRDEDELINRIIDLKDNMNECQQKIKYFNKRFNKYHKGSSNKVLKKIGLY